MPRTGATPSTTSGTCSTRRSSSSGTQSANSLDSGARAMAELLDRVPDLDAVLAASDLMAAGALTTLRKDGLNVPGDAGVAGFDDTGPAARLDPPLTTMHQPFDRIGAEMIDLLLQVMDGGDQASLTLPADLVVRRST
ncbi:substrate-binding domain-containing protein [Pseudactinotalea sp. Z1739]|uniref:substrate-binding domain-containing protein n=1 Tax=Pseudactinotalea sp. Z1739 TaxID=3413028 RepID=UPI003C7C15DC